MFARRLGSETVHVIVGEYATVLVTACSFWGARTGWNYPEQYPTCKKCLGIGSKS